MPLTAEELNRLAAIGLNTEENLVFWQRLWERERPSLCQMMLDNAEKTAMAWQYWMPKLQAYSADCRQRFPAPQISAMSGVEREQHRILLQRMKEFAASPDARMLTMRQNPLMQHRTAMVFTNWAGQSAGEEVFGESGPIVLEKSERDQWFAKIFECDDQRQWWYSEFGWYVTEIRHGFKGSMLVPDEQRLRADYPIPEDSTYWMLEQRAGSIKQEIWKFDGSSAEFIACDCIMT